jgi:hypothetical protein
MSQLEPQPQAAHAGPSRCSSCQTDYVYKDGLCWSCWLATVPYPSQTVTWAEETYDLATMSSEAMHALWMDVCHWACDTTERQVQGTITRQDAFNQLEDCRRVTFYLTAEFDRRGE